MDEFIRQARAMADPTRARILKLLEAGELCVCQVMEVLGLGQSTASKHLGILRAVGLVEVRREGIWSHYRLAETVRGRNTDFLGFIARHLGDDAQVKKDRRLLATRKPDACKEP